MEEESSKRNHREAIIEEGGIWEASGRNLGRIWEAPECSQRLQEARGSRRLQTTKIDGRLSYNTKVTLTC